MANLEKYIQHGRVFRSAVEIAFASNNWTTPQHTRFKDGTTNAGMWWLRVANLHLALSRKSRPKGD